MANVTPNIGPPAGSPVDPFLTAHQIGRLIYSVGGKLSPVSLRDQFLRGELFVHRACDADLIGPDRLPLVVAGAGAAGVAAAYCAVIRYGCRVYLVDKMEEPFTAQAATSMRRVDPTMYDFPAFHWPRNQYPADPPPPPEPPAGWRIPWVAGDAQALASRWRAQFRAVVPRYRRLRYIPSAEVVWPVRPNLNDPGGAVLARVRYLPGSKAPPGRRVGTVRAAAVLMATGFGRERRYLRDRGQPPGPTWGHEFWAEDPLSDPDYGLPPTAGAARVLISGSGDGALQDFLRVATTCRTTWDVYNALFADDRYAVIPAVLRRLQDATERAARQVCWGNGADDDHDPLTELHEAHLWAADELFLDRHLGPRLSVRVRQILRRPFPAIRFVHSCDHFAISYSLNRLLVLIIRAYLRNAGRRDGVLTGHRTVNDIFLAGRRVLDIRPAPGSRHVCNQNPADCHGEPHTVEWGWNRDCRDRATGGAGTFDANVLVLRHGVDTDDLPYDPTPPLSRQVLPYGPPPYTV